jgi:hypothetical protein
MPGARRPTLISALYLPRPVRERTHLPWPPSKGVATPERAPAKEETNHLGATATISVRFSAPGDGGLPHEGKGKGGKGVQVKQRWGRPIPPPPPLPQAPSDGGLPCKPRGPGRHKAPRRRPDKAAPQGTMVKQGRRSGDKRRDDLSYPPAAAAVSHPGPDSTGEVCCLGGVLCSHKSYPQPARNPSPDDQRLLCPFPSPAVHPQHTRPLNHAFTHAHTQSTHARMLTRRPGAARCR